MRWFLSGLLTVLVAMIIWNRYAWVSRERSPSLFPVQLEGIKGFTITVVGNPPIVVEKADASWTLVGPQRTPANERIINTVLTTVLQFRLQKDIAFGFEHLAEYGLQEPRIAVELEDFAGNRYMLHVGDAAPTGFGIYVRRPPSPQIYLGGGHLYVALNRQPAELQVKAVGL